ncbi:MAG: RuBisCO large subunit C-terminal-like domain-containing protein [Chloroflexota bacterium]
MDDPQGIDPSQFVVATYQYRATAGTDIDRLARSLAELQSSGAWVDLAGETDLIRRRHAARVVRTWEIPDEAATWGIEIAYPTHNTAGQIPLLLATVYGECASWRDLKLTDLQLSEPFVSAFRGPAVGLDRIRELVDAPGRPLLVTILKPAIGLTPTESAAVFYEAAVGGSDAVKDDEKVVSQPWSDFLERVCEHGRAATAAYEQTGHRTLYFVNITDRPDRLVANAHAAVQAGASALLVNAWTVGVSALSVLADDPTIGVPIMSHLAFAGAVSGSPSSGMSPHLALGTLPRLAGADVAVYPSHLGTLPFSRDDALRVSAALTGPWFGMRRALPLAGGGLHAGMVPRLVADLGIDWALAAGGGVHGHPMGTAAGARSIRQAFDAAVRGEPLAEARKANPELAAALEKWPEPEA